MTKPMPTSERPPGVAYADVARLLADRLGSTALLERAVARRLWSRSPERSAEQRSYALGSADGLCDAIATIAGLDETSVWQAVVAEAGV